MASILGLFTVNPAVFQLVVIGLWLFELVVSLLIVKRVPYTEIDWSTYMQQVKLYASGERNYSRIEGDTGPCVYPAGYLLVYHVLYVLTSKGTDILTAQYIFVAIYLINLLLIFRLYYKSNQIAPYALAFVCLTGYRIHSIFILRLFNDPVAMCLFYMAVNLLVSHRWGTGCVLYSLAVSVKMNVLLYAPALFFLLLTNCGWASTMWHIALCAIVQLFLCMPFLVVDPYAYLTRSFDLSRVFLYKWTVNWRFLPEEMFLDRRLHVLLLLLHVVLLASFASFVWFRSHGGLFRSLKQLGHGIRIRIGPSECMLALFTSNLAGMVFARSLHYQFYSWYYHQLAFLLFRETVSVNGKIPFVSIIAKSLLLLCVEYSWNVYPSTVFSSSLLFACHMIIVAYLFLTTSTLEKPAKSKLF